MVVCEKRVNYLCANKQKFDFMDVMNSMAQRLEAINNYLASASKLINEYKTILETTPKSRFLPMAAAAEFMRMKVNTLYRMTMRKEIPYFKPGGKQIYFAIEDLEEWMTRNRQKSVYEIESEIVKN